MGCPRGTRGEVVRNGFSAEGKGSFDLMGVNLDVRDCLIATSCIISIC